MPCGVWCTSGWNCTAYHLFAGSECRRRRSASSPSIRSPEAVRALHRRATSRRRVSSPGPETDIESETMSTSACPYSRFVRRTHLAAERVHHELQSVADAKHRHAQLEHARIGGRRVFVIDRPRRARENDARRARGSSLRRASPCTAARRKKHSARGCGER